MSDEETIIPPIPPHAQKQAINAMVEQIHSASVAAGWWFDPDFGDLRAEPIAKYAIPTKIALIHSETSEALEGFRKDLPDDHLPERPAIEVELADDFIRILDLAGALKLDLGGAVVAKMAYNKIRADHKPEARLADHGKKF